MPSLPAWSILHLFDTPPCLAVRHALGDPLTQLRELEDHCQWALSMADINEREAIRLHQENCHAR